MMVEPKQAKKMVRILLDQNDISVFWFAVNTPLGVGECWEWTGFRIWNGYGRFWKSQRNNVRGKWILAHRVSYELVIGKIPKNMVLDHLCRNRLCVNPYHLEVTTFRDNILRGNGLAAMQAKQTHCKRGHLLEGDNLYKSA